MGVIKDPYLITNQEFSDDGSNLQDDMFLSETESEESIRIPVGNYKKIKKLQRIQNKNFGDNYLRFADKTSKRRQRIVENSKFLTQLNENLGTNKDDDISIDDFVVNNFSAFTMLFSQAENIKAWDDFVNANEEDQIKFLKNIETSNCKHLEVIQEEEVEEQVISDDIRKCSSNFCRKCLKNMDYRKIHPSYFNAKQAFLKIDNHIKSALNKRHLPLNSILSLEKELRSFFTHYPNSVFKTTLESSYQRLLMHGICKYLDLISKSDETKTPKQTTVKNNKRKFTPPKLHLVEFLGVELSDIMRPTENAP